MSNYNNTFKYHEIFGNTSTTNATSDSICVLINKYSKLKDNESTTSTNTTVKNLSNNISQLTGDEIFIYLKTNKEQVIKDINFLIELIKGHINQTNQTKQTKKTKLENNKLKEIGEQLSISFTNEKDKSNKLINIFFDTKSKNLFMERFCDKSSSLSKEKQHIDINKKFKDMIEIIKKFEMYSIYYNKCKSINSLSEWCSSFRKWEPSIVKVKDKTIKELIVLLNNLTSEKFEQFEQFDNLIIKVIDS